MFNFVKQILLKLIHIILLKIYNEEFDPGSGWTLAAGLTHASRGVTGVLALADDRRTGA